MEAAQPLAELPADGSLVARAAHRSVALRHAASAAEIQRIIDATYRVIERTSDVDPTVRAILREAELSTPAFYRHFRSKDELFVVILDDGRRKLAGSIERRVARERTGPARLRAWIRTVLAQASDAEAASRTRPFMANLDRLVAQYPDEHRESEALLVDQLARLIADADDLSSRDPSADAEAVYHLAFGAMAAHLRHGTAPSPADVERIVDFALRALSVPG